MKQRFGFTQRSASATNPADVHILTSKRFGKSSRSFHSLEQASELFRSSGPPGGLERSGKASANVLSIYKTVTIH